MPWRSVRLAALFSAGIAGAAALAGCRGGGGNGTLAAKASTVIAGAVAGSTASAETAPQTVTAPATPPVTLTETSVAQHTVNQTVTAAPPAPATTTSESSASGTPGWVWVIVGVGAAALVALVVVLLHRRRHAAELPVEERQQRLFTAVTSWTARGWRIDSETGLSAVLSRNGQRMLVDVDSEGRINANPLADSAPAGSSRD